jgi:hypothetical protein
MKSTVLPQPTDGGKRFSFPPEPLKIPADQMKSTLEWFTQKSTPDVANSVMASMWFLKIDAFRKLEEKDLAEGHYEETLPIHRVVLSSLIADGEFVLFQVKAHGMAATPSNFTVEDIKATLSSLHETFQCAHGNKNSPEVNRVLEGMLNGQGA